MEKLEISRSEFILGALYMLNEYKGRRAVSLEEADIFEVKVKSKLAEQGFEVEYPKNYGIGVELYCDYIMVDDKHFVYRLKPIINYLDILNVLGSRLKSLVLEDETLLEGLNDYTEQDEKEVRQFQEVDKSYYDQILEKMDSITRDYNAEIGRLQELLGNINKRRK